MRNLHRLFAIIAVVALAACATAQTSVRPAAAADPAAAQSPAPPPPSTLASINAKLDNAIAIADAGGDAAGAACWTQVQSWVGTLPIPQATPALPAPMGLSGEMETHRIKVKAAQAKVSALKLALAAGVPEPVHNACAVLWIDAAEVGGKILGILGLIAK